MTATGVHQRPELIPWAVSLASVAAIAVLDGLGHPVPNALLAIAALAGGGGAGMSIPTPRISGGSSLMSQLSDLTAQLDAAFGAISGALTTDASLATPADVSALKTLVDHISSVADSLKSASSASASTPTATGSVTGPTAGAPVTTTRPVTPTTAAPVTTATGTPTTATGTPADPTAPVQAVHPLLG